MKLLKFLVASNVIESRKLNVNDIHRNVSGNYLESLTGFLERGYNYGDANSMRGLATIAAFAMAPFQNNQRSDATSIEAFEFSVIDFIDKFTNYGCYCWILGVDKGVIGGGQTQDQIDGLCGQLYKCYKCLNIDYGNQQTLFNYDVSLIVHEDGEREIKCLDGPNIDACKCDKMFSENLVDVSKKCQEDQAAGITNSPFCPNDEFRTENGGGTLTRLITVKMGASKMDLAIIIVKMDAVANIQIVSHMIR